MCRGDDHGGRRCPGDTSDARRARRYATSAASKSSTMARSSLRADPPPAPAVDERPEVEQLTEEATKLREAMRACEEVAIKSSEILGGLRRIYRDDKDAMFDKFTEALDEKLQGLDVDERFVGPGREYLFDTRTGTYSWAVAEKHVTELGARTDRWLDGELLDQAQAVADAEEKDRDLTAQSSALGNELNEARRATPALFVKPGMTDAEIEEVRAHNLERERGLSPLYARREALDLQREAVWETLRSERDAYYVRKRELLGQIRPMGGDLKWSDGGVKTSKEVGEEIRKAAAMLPSDWIEASNAGQRGEVSTWSFQSSGLKEMRVRESSVRSHYSGHKSVTRRENFPLRHTSSYGRMTRQEYLDHLASDPEKKIIPQDEWTESEVQNAYIDSVVYEECDVAYPGRYFSPAYDYYGPRRKSKLEGRYLVKDDGSLALTGAAAKGWEKHEYVDRNGEDRYCWRRVRTRSEVTKEAGLAELTYPKGSKGSSVTLHELTHRAEDANRRIGSLEGRFVLRRTTDENGDRHPDEPYHDTKKHRSERVRPDSFVDRYIGKDYQSSTYYEVMSMGNEIALYGRMGGFGKVTTDHTRPEDVVRDDDHHAFVLGTLLSA